MPNNDHQDLILPEGCDTCAAKTGSGKTRRDFLKLLGQATVVLTAARFGASAAGATETPPAEAHVAEQWDLHKWGMAVDVEKCIGCGRCVVACKAENSVPKEPTYFRTWVERYREYEDDVVVDSPNGGYDGFPADDGGRTPDRAFFVPKLCNHCDKAPCVQVCPVGATFKTPDGAVLVDASYCIGCRYCIQACPYGARYLNPVTQTADKCTLCYHRIHKGLKPACVENCPTGARIFGDLKDPNDPLRKYLHDHKVFVLKQQLNTYPKVFYYGIDKEVR
ncbi:MAG TPA: 4Fe-4S dicluster domain-containing protein [bacterium]|jgi:Fe-S-cluster-containing dehydrogenase component